MKFFLIISYIKQRPSRKACIARKMRHKNILKIQDVERRLFELQMTLAVDMAIAFQMKDIIACNSYPGMVACHGQQSSSLFSTQTAAWKPKAKLSHPSSRGVIRWKHQVLDPVESVRLRVAGRREAARDGGRKGVLRQQRAGQSAVHSAR